MSKFKGGFLPLMVLLSVFSAQGAQTAKVLMKRGKVTKLAPAARTAEEVKVGDLLAEDTSVLTGERSLVRLKFSDNSIMNLGPKSKVVVTKMPEKKPNMISLLTGAIKAEVDKKENTDQENENKMIIKTRSAVMGVRGTKFQAIYNPENKNTSLITVEGKVAMVKKESIVQKNPQDLHVADSETELEALDQKLNQSDRVVEVEAGEYSGAQDLNDAPTEPVNIAPEQYEALAKSMGSSNTAQEVMGGDDLESLGQLGEKGKAPRPGGFVDFQTGIYVPPSEDAKLDEGTATFVAQDLGEVDPSTGDYIPPRGVKLDPRKGFVVDREEVARVASAQEEKELQATIAKMTAVNTKIKDQVEVNQIAAESEGDKPWYKVESHELQALFLPYSEVLIMESHGDHSEFYTESAYDTIFTYQQNWNDRFATRISFGSVEYKIDKQDEDFREVNDDEDEYFSIGAVYSPESRLSYSVDLASRTFYFAYPSDFGDGAVIDSTSLQYLTAGARYHGLNWNKIDLYARAELLLFEEKTLHPEGGGSETFNSYGLGLAGEGVYSFAANMGLNAQLFARRIIHDFDEETEFIRTSIGSGFNFFWRL